ncbi:hypothetical protein [Pedobacter sp. SYSU D00535]|uniref:hypothetical protein n=1 Tax=Pedobacter sp. SYSU D00535 TaxID=2810308 RepID=UPI001A960007|nr:hypothetical protein [Pedobacter sp. SYSU D00535]
MNRAHTDEEILAKAAAIDKNQEQIKDNRVDVPVDIEDETGTAHTYVVTFIRSGETEPWKASEINELSSL